VPAITGLTGTLSLSLLGGDSITLTGTDFSVGAPAVISAGYSNGALSYTATSCSVTAAHTKIVCASFVGMGRQQTFCVIFLCVVSVFY
jgi:hypothetical protein